MRRVVITGMSEICAAGSEHNEVFRNLCEKKIDLHEIEKNNPAREKICSRFYIPYPEFDDSKYKDKLRQVKRRGAKSAYTACASALMALDDASIEVPDDDTRVYMGVGAPNMYELMEQTFKLEETQKVDLLLIPMTMQSSLAGMDLHRAGDPRQKLRTEHGLRLRHRSRRLRLREYSERTVRYGSLRRQRLPAG